MKKAIEKAKWAALAAAVLLVLGLGLGLRADIKYFWLDHPSGRTNPNDPMSPFYRSPTPAATPGPAHTATPTETFSVSPTPSDTPSPLGTSTDTMTVTDSPTQSPTPTLTSTPAPAGWPDLYGYSSTGFVSLTTSTGTNFINDSAGYSSATTEVGPGPATDGSYLAISLSCAAGVNSAAAEISTGFTGPSTPKVQNASSYNALSISVQIPASGNCIVPAVALIDDSSGNTESIAVSVEPYILGGAQFLAPGTWYTAVIPLSVFTSGEDGTGWNGQAVPNSDTFTAADLAGITGVVIQPTNYAMTTYPAPGNAGALPLTTFNVDDVSFINAAGLPTVSTDLAQGQPVLGETAMFCDFEHGAQTNWGDYWASWSDGDADDAATPSAGFSGICTGAGSVTTRVFPTCTNCPVTGAPGTAQLNPPITSTDGAGGTGNNPTPCDFGRFAGTMGSEANGTDCSNANPSTLYSFFGISAYFLASHATANILQILQAPPFGIMPRPAGIQLDIKAGPNDGCAPCQQYQLAITMNNYPAANGAPVGAELLPTATWQTVDIPFPTATGAVPTATGGYTYSPLVFSLPSWGGSYTWTVDPTAGETDDTLSNFIQLKIQSETRGKAVDLEVDNIQFYYPAGSTLATPSWRRR